MDESFKMRDCYAMADAILKPFEKENSKGVNDPLAYICLAQLLFSWKYERKNMSTNQERIKSMIRP